MSQTLDNLSYTWNNAGTTFTGIKYNVTDTASASGSLLMDLQVGGVSKISIDKTGAIKSPGSLNIYGVGNSAVNIYSNSIDAAFGNNFSTFYKTVQLQDSLRFTSDLSIFRDAANTLAQRNSTNAQELRLYNTYTDASNYERAKFKWDTNVLKIGTEKAGTGGARALELQTDGTSRIIVGADGVVTIRSTVIQNHYNATVVTATTAGGIPSLTYSDGTSMSVGSSSGTKIGVATSQKLAFWNATPIVQPDTSVAAATAASTGTGDVVAASTTFDGYTIPQVVKALRNAGLLA